MTTNHPLSAEPAFHGNGALLRALVMGGGIPAEVATQTLAAMGVDVTFARFPDTPTHLYFPQPGTESEDFNSSLSLCHAAIKTIDVDLPPVIRRSKQGFAALFADGASLLYDCLLVAPGVTLRPKPSSMPDHTELFTSDIEIKPGERIVFLMDYLHPSDPALGMTAMKAAARNALNGGSSVVCFTHVPVLHLFGETLYDEARKAGVQFVRFGEELPTILPPDPSENPQRFRLVARDVIDQEEEFVYECDRVALVTGPDAASIPEWAKKIAGKDLDDRGFVLSESVLCSSGTAFASGVFLVGEGTGNMDLIGCVAQARSAAAKAFAWMKASRVKTAEDPVSVSSACVGCLTCHRVCPHRAVVVQVEPSRARIEPVPALCRECGICASVCPSVAIRVHACPEESMTHLVRDVPAPEIERTLFVFGCQRSAGVIAATVNMPEDVRFLAVPCAGSVSEHVIWSALVAGARGILVIGCHHGNCASHTGTDWAAARVRRALETGLFRNEAPRVGYQTVAANEPTRFQRLVTKFLADLPILDRKPKDS